MQSIEGSMGHFEIGQEGHIGSVYISLARTQSYDPKIMLNEAGESCLVQTGLGVHLAHLCLR